MTMAVRRSMSAGLLNSESAGFSKYESELFEGPSVCSAVDYGAGDAGCTPNNPEKSSL